MWVDFFVSWLWCDPWEEIQGKRVGGRIVDERMKGRYPLNTCGLAAGVCLGLDSDPLLPGPPPGSLQTAGGSSSLELVTFRCCIVYSLLLFLSPS